MIENSKIESREPVSHPYTEGAELKIKNSGAPVKAGDTIILKAGHHGDIQILSYFNSQYINVIAEAGATVSRLEVVSGSRWRFKGLTVRPDDGYKTVDDFLSAAKLTVDASLKAQLSVDSQHFLLRAEARVGDGHAMLYSILYREEDGVRVLRRSFGNQD